MAKTKKKAGEINSSSMADIAFLLLIFFLVTTTMDVDKGMKRTLPPSGNEKEQDSPEMKERNVLTVNVSKTGRIMVGSKEYTRRDLDRQGEHSVLSKETYQFLVDADRSEKKAVEIDGKMYDISEGVVSLMADNETKYDVYIQVQDELTYAFSLYRDLISTRVYGTPFNDLDDEIQIQKIRRAVPPRISEAKPNSGN